MQILKRNNVNVLGSGGPVFLYAHGFGCNQDMWSGITPAFGDTHTQILFDYVGSGKSDISAFSAEKYSTLDGYAQDVLEVCDALNLTSGVTLVGHSVSGSIGLLASIARPGLFERMILIGPSPCFINHPPHYLGGFDRSDLEELLALMEQNYIGWANYLAPIVAGAAVGSEVANQLADSFCSTDPLIAHTFAKATFFADNRNDLEKVACPTLIIQHRHDTLAPLSVGEYMHARLKDSVLKVIDVNGHCGHMSHPDLIIGTMREYFHLVSSSPSGSHA